jgi:hypothetical protein
MGIIPPVAGAPAAPAALDSEVAAASFGWVPPGALTSPPQAAALSVAAVNATIAARLICSLGIARAGILVIASATAAPQNGHAISFVRMCRLHSGQATKLMT